MKREKLDQYIATGFGSKQLQAAMAESHENLVALAARVDEHRRRLDAECNGNENGWNTYRRERDALAARVAALETKQGKERTEATPDFTPARGSPVADGSASPASPPSPAPSPRPFRVGEVSWTQEQHAKVDAEIARWAKTHPAVTDAPAPESEPATGECQHRTHDECLSSELKAALSERDAAVRERDEARADATLWKKHNETLAARLRSIREELDA